MKYLLILELGQTLWCIFGQEAKSGSPALCTPERICNSNTQYSLSVLARHHIHTHGEVEE